jgi:hypothetical protein
MILTQPLEPIERINVKSDDKGSSIITLAMQGPNKSQNGRIFECHRQDVIKRQLDGKNQFATNTIAFDSVSGHGVAA